MNSTMRKVILFLSCAVLVLIFGSPSAQARPTQRHARISSARAKAIALKKYPGKVEGKVALENEEGSWQYAVNIRSGKVLREVMVNARTGKIASVEVTTKAEEAREKKVEARAASKKPRHGAGG